MRLLLLISALLAALSGVGSVASAGAEPVQASVLASPVRSASRTVAAVALPSAGPIAAIAGWHAAPAPALARDYPIYADRRRE